MVDVSVIENFLQRISVDMDLTEVDRDGYGDIVAAFNPKADFLKVRQAIHDYTPYFSKIVDNGAEFVEIRDSIYVEGSRTNISILVSTGEFHKGVMIKVMVKSVNYVIDGEVKTFTGFRALKEYKDSFVVE